MWILIVIKCEVAVRKVVKELTEESVQLSV